MAGEIAARWLPAPIQAGRRWGIERTHAWGNQYGKLRWRPERRRLVVGVGWPWPAPSSSLAGCSAVHGPAIDGTPAYDDDHSRLPIHPKR
jgi:hypothetical protein